MVKRLISQRTIKVSNRSGQSRVMKWAEFCFMFVGAKNSSEILRIDKELTDTAASTWIAADGEEIAIHAEDWWPRGEENTYGK